jgi:bisphosphoglycerate-independent phosphoglycerate mutase (AlkP superfamily)
MGMIYEIHAKRLRGHGMSLIKIDTDGVLFIRYRQDNVRDMEELKRDLERERYSTKFRDTVVEFVNAAMAYSSEIGILVQFANSLPAGRTLHIVTSNYICEMLTTMNIHKVDHAALHDNLEWMRTRFPEIDLDALPGFED